MNEIENYELKLKDKDKSIESLRHTVDINFQLVHQIREINQIINYSEPSDEIMNFNEYDIEEGEQRLEPFDANHMCESYEPETLAEFGQIQEVQKLKENVTTLVRQTSYNVMLPEQVQKTLDEKNNMISKMREEIKSMKMTTTDLIMLGNEQVEQNDLRVHKLMLQEEKTKQAFNETEAAEKETARNIIRQNWDEQIDLEDNEDTASLKHPEMTKLDNSGQFDVNGSVENLTQRVKKELELSDQLDKSLLNYQGDIGQPKLEDLDDVDDVLDNLSKQIVDTLLQRINKKGSQFSHDKDTTGNSNQVVYMPVSNVKKNKSQLSSLGTFNKNEISTNNVKHFDTNHVMNKTDGEHNNNTKQTIDSLNFKLKEDEQHIKELTTAVKKEREQTLKLMEKLNLEQRCKSLLEDETISLGEEISSLQNQLLKYQDEVEELTVLYQSEKNQNSTLEASLAAEKKNFNQIVTNLEHERQRTKDISTRDSDTIIELRTALTVEKEQGSRQALNSPFLRTKSLQGSKLSLYGSRNSLGGHKSPALPQPDKNWDRDQKVDRLMEDLADERLRCDKLRECLEIEREENFHKRENYELEITDFGNQLQIKEEESEQAMRFLDKIEIQKSQVLRELLISTEQVTELSNKIELMENQDKRYSSEKKDAHQRFSSFYVEDLESKLEAYRIREDEILSQLESLQKAKETVINQNQGLPGTIKNIPQVPEDQAVFFYRKLLRAESYRKALVWQKRYLSLLLSSYQESEMLSLGRLARMSGARKMLVADVTSYEGSNAKFKVVVHMITAINRMKFLVKRWKNTKKSINQSWPPSHLKNTIRTTGRHGSESTERLSSDNQFEKRGKSK